MALQTRPFELHSRVAAIGKTSAIADCPWCLARVVIYLWSFAGCGRKRCACGAMFRRDGECEKQVSDDA